VDRNDASAGKKVPSGAAMNDASLDEGRIVCATRPSPSRGVKMGAALETAGDF